MRRVRQDRVALTGGARDCPLHSAIGTAANHIFSAKHGQEGLLKCLELLPGGKIHGDIRVIWAHRDQEWKLGQTLLVRRRGMGCPVGPVNRIADPFGKSGLEHEPRETSRAFHERSPEIKKPVAASADRHSAVGNDHPIETLRMVCNQMQTDCSAPILTIQRDLVQIHREQPLRHPVNMSRQGVISFGCRFIRTTVPDQVHGNHATPRRG